MPGGDLFSKPETRLSPTTLVIVALLGGAGAGGGASQFSSTDKTAELLAQQNKLIEAQTEVMAGMRDAMREYLIVTRGK